MKKSLLTLGCMICAGASLLAQSKVYENMVFTNISRNGDWAAGALMGDVMLVNLRTGETKLFAGDGNTLQYEVGNGTAISNDGILIGATNPSNGAYYANGEWTVLSKGNADESSVYQAADITPDGSRICGAMGGGDMMGDETMIFPCVWNRNADGTYSDPVMLPHPDKDFTGRAPQYITAVSISDDGKRIMGQMVDYTGFERQPLLYTLGEDGEWTCTEICAYLINPDGIEIPKYPGDSPALVDEKDYMTEDEMAAYDAAAAAYSEYFRNQPQKMDYMSDDSRLDYEDALAAYFADPDNNPYPLLDDFMTEEDRARYDAAVNDFYANAPEYPEYTSFMTEENKAKYLAAKEEFDREYAIWDEAYTSFMQGYSAALEASPQYEFNTLRISCDGTKGQATGVINYYDPMTMTGFSETTVYIFDLDNNTCVKHKTESPMIARQVLADGNVLVNSYPGVSIYNKAYVMTAATGELTPIEQYYADNNKPELVKFIEDNMTHDVVSFDPDTFEEVILENQVVTGVAAASDDLSVYVSYVENVWDLDSDVYYLSYALIDGTGSVESAVADAAGEIKARLDADGTLRLAGDVVSVTIYDINGRMVYSTDTPAASQGTGLGHGAYIIKATGVTRNATVKAVI